MGDLRYAVRQLAHAPAFTAVAVVCLALGIGANSTVFSLVDGCWTRPLAVPDARGLVYLNTATPHDDSAALSYAEYLDYASRAHCFRGLLATERRGGTLKGEGFTDAVASNVVSENYFEVLGIAAEAGRVFTAADRAGGRVLVMSHNLWMRRYGGDRAIVGRTVRINGLYTVVGIAPEGFRGAEAWRDSDVWIPMTSWNPAGDEALQREYRSMTVMGRLRAGTGMAAARAELAGISAELAREWPRSNTGCRAVLRTDAERLVDFKLPFLLLGVVALVLAIACANVAGLLLARAGQRRQEMAMRQALGASRWRLVSQLMTESALLGVLGTAAGLALARVLIAALPAVIVPPAASYMHYEFRLDGRVLAFTLLASLLTVFGFGLAPALGASRAIVRTPRRAYSRRVLVVAQIALAVVLLAGGGVFVLSFVHALSLDPGFTRRDVLVAEVDPPYGPARSRAFYERLIERFRGLPGVLDATVALRAPLSGSGGGLAIETSIERGVPSRVKYTAIGASYFRTLGIPLARGRDFDARDAGGGAPVAIVNQTMARRFWPNEDALGKTLHLGGGAPEDRTVVGVATDARVNSMEEPAEPYFYLPYAQTAFSGMVLIARTAIDPAQFARPLRTAVAETDRSVPVLDITRMKLLVRATVYERQVSATIVGSLGLIGLILAAIGLYGVVACAVSERTRELGIRIALGAQPRDARWLVLQQSLGLAACGIALGLAGALYALRALDALVTGVTAHDPATLAAVALVMLAAVLVASDAPARRATRIDPAEALRHD